MRKKGIIVLVVLVVLIAAIAFFTQDWRIEKMLESLGEAAAGAKVEIDQFHFSFLKMECSWNRLQVANKNDPWKNILETGKATFDIEARALFWRRVIIKEMALEDVRSGTPRKTEGSLPKKIEPAKETEPGFIDKVKLSLEKQFGEIPVFDLSGLGKKLKVDSLINIDNLLAVQGYKKLYATADSTFEYWNKQGDVKPYLEKATKLEDDIKSLNLDEIKTLTGLTDALKKVNDINKEIKSLKEDVQVKYTTLTQSLADLQSGVKAVQQNVKDDIDRAKQLAHLKDLDAKDVSMLLFGEPVVYKTQQILHYVELGRKYLPLAQKLKSKPKKESPPRLKGQDIYFPFHYRYPKFLIKRAFLSGATAAGDTSRAYFIEGDITGLTNEPAVYAKPTHFLFDLKKVAGNAYRLKGTADHRGEVACDSLWVTAANFALGDIKLKKSKYFPQSIEAKKGNVTLTGFFIGEKINLKLNLDVSPVKFNFGEAKKDKISQIIQEVIAGVNNVTLMAQLSGEKSDYKMRMNSNLDQLLSDQIKQTIAKNLQQAQQLIENYVQAEIAKQREKVEALIDKNQKAIYAKINDAKMVIEKKTDEFENKKKELEARIEQEKKKLEDQAKNKLRDMFKKP